MMHRSDRPPSRSGGWSPLESGDATRYDGLLRRRERDVSGRASGDFFEGRNGCSSGLGARFRRDDAVIAGVRSVGPMLADKGRAECDTVYLRP